MKTQTNKAIYIRSIEASDIHNHLVRGTEIKAEYAGMIPFSLESIKLLKSGLKAKPVKTDGKHQSDDMINVKFKQKVNSGSQLIKHLNEKIAKLDAEIKECKDDDKKEDKEDYKGKLEAFIKVIESEIKTDKWKEVSSDKLREDLYKNGFTINGVKYEVYKRSSAKSRKGEVLFIKSILKDEMIGWSRMYLPFKDNMEIDYPSLLAYESLVGSSLESLLVIDPDKILIVDDVDSKFDQLCNVVRKGKNGLVSKEDNVEVSNSLFDGESLLDTKHFENAKGMKLLRSHMFKSCSFNTDIQAYLKANCPTGINYDEWEIENMFGDTMLASTIELIITPSSLKALKFSHVLEGEDKEKQMFNYWKELVKEEGMTFGVCKEEKPSKLQCDEDGKVLQQMSYQMLNSMQMEPEQMEALSIIEVNYVEQLKNNDSVFIEHIRKAANDQNSNMMYVTLFETNKDIVNTKIFRDFRKVEISSYVSHIKKGKIRVNADYVVLLGNPMEFLQHAIGKFDVNKSELALSDNEIYTTLFDFKKELVGFRNPHTSPSNVLVAKNTYVKDIETYFNLTDNIVCVNAVKFALQDKLSGCDYDSDTCLLVDSELIHTLATDCEKYLVDINKVIPEPRKYKLNLMDMAFIDNKLSESSKFIGQVVNLGQFCMSAYYDQLANGKSADDLEELFEKVSIMTVLSGICIDLAKKFYEINIDKEIRIVEKYVNQYSRTVEVEKKGKKVTKKAKPQFWKYISKSKTIKDRVTTYDCPMDMLYEIMTGLKYATKHTDMDFLDLLIKKDIRKGNHKQEYKIVDIVEELCTELNGIHAKKMSDEERNILVDTKIKHYTYKVEKLSVKPDTMYAMLVHMVKNKSNNSTKLMNVLYTTQRETFLEAFKINK